MKPARKSKFTLLLSEEEKRLLSELAESQHPPLSAAMYLRWMIHTHHKRLRK